MENDIVIHVQDNSAKVKNIVHSRVLVALEASGLLAERLAKQICPVDTGRLRNSITHATSGQPARTHQYAPQYVSKLEGGVGENGKRKSMNKAQKKLETRTETIPAVPEKEETMYIGTNVEYAPYIEIGGIVNGRYRAPRPFLKPALQDHKSKYKAIFKKYLKG